MTFEQLELMKTLLDNVHASGYHTPTPIQEATIPLVLARKDVLGCAQTGTGKTAAFALPILQNLAQTPRDKEAPRVIRTLILTPTRELALQIYENFLAYGKKLPINCAVIFGGVAQQGQVNALHRGAEVVIACPGRLWDLMNQGYVRLDWVETFVLDEADRMLDMGFIHDVRRIAGKLPEKHQTLLFSATMPPEVEKLAMDLLHNPETVKVDPVSSTVEAIQQKLYYVDKVNKKHLLAKLLREDDVENALVFSRTRHGADRIVRELKREGIEAVAIHGDKSQGARQQALTRFKTGDVKVLVATDIAARGIDIAGLSHVFNYDLPMEPESYVHRIGRTGRAGREGMAISFCCIDEMKQLGQVEKLIGKRLSVTESEWPMEVTTPSEPKQRQPRPAKGQPLPTKVTRSGEALPEKKGNRKESRLPKAGAPITIGKDGKVKEAPKVEKVAKPAGKKPQGREVAPKEAPAVPAQREADILRLLQARASRTRSFGPQGSKASSAGTQIKTIRQTAMVNPVKQEGGQSNRKQGKPQGRNSGTGRPVQRVNRRRKG